MRGETARPGKRPLRALSATEKMDAIQRVRDGESKASVARDIGVPESTLRGWCKSEHKIRSMARNSSTPDSEAHSPDSSSGANPMISNLSSEDEATGPTNKKVKQEKMNDNGDGIDIKLENAKQPPGMDYVTNIINNLMASGVRSDNSALILQQLGMLSSAQSAASITKNILNLSSASLSAAHLGSSAQAVGLVENGLQYSKNSVGNSNHHSNKRHSSAHISVIAPMSHLDSVSKSRRSLPPAAEAPTTPVPASPRKTSESSSFMGMNLSAKNGPGENGVSNTSSSTRKTDDALWLWLAQHNQFLGQAPFNPAASTVDGSWFWQWYKQCNFPTPMSASVTKQHVPLAARDSPNKIKANIDAGLLSNNNDKVRRTLHYSGTGSNGHTEEEDAETRIEEAIEHGSIFLNWLDSCSEPVVTQLQVMQFKFMLNKLKTRNVKRIGSKHSRK